MYKIISGIKPGNTGVGKVLQYFRNTHKVKIVTKPEKVGLKTHIKNKEIIILLMNMMKYIYDLLFFFYQIYNIKNAKIIIIHPQSIDPRYLKKIAHAKEIVIYLMDNSFFCIQSYNYDTKNKTECIRCLGNSSKPYEHCKQFPNENSLFTKLFIEKLVEKNNNKLSFWVQNKGQEFLLRSHFEKNIDINIIGLVISDLEIITNESNKDSSLKNKKYDVVYHGDLIDAKGYRLVIDLALKNPKLSFFIPCDMNDLKVKVEDVPANVDAYSCRWESGLKEKVINSRSVIVPSIWSMPIEGALLKSISLNKNVLALKSKYGFGYIDEALSDNVVKEITSKYFEQDNLLDSLIVREVNESEIHFWLEKYIYNSKQKLNDIIKNV